MSADIPIVTAPKGDRINLNPSPAERVQMRDALIRMGLSEKDLIDFYSYRVLEVGSKGDVVVRLKQRMYELGYFQSVTQNRTYTATTAEYVKEFQRVNGLAQTGTMSPIEQLWFYSDFAIPLKGFTYERYDYKDIARNIELYDGLRWKFTARVVQQIDVKGSPDINAILSISGNVVYAYIEGFKDWEWTGKFADTGVGRLLENDKVDVECRVQGEYTYKTISNETLTVPHGIVENFTLYD